MDKIDRFSKELNREEIELAAEKLGIQLGYGTRKLLDMIRLKFLKDGIPEELENSIFTEIIESELVDLPETFPDCYGHADDNDKACGSCKLYIPCGMQLFENLPDCYGELYNEAKCNFCIVNMPCCVPVKFENLDKPEDCLEIQFLDEKDILTNQLEALARIKRIYKSWPSRIYADKNYRGFNIKSMSRGECDMKDALYFQVTEGEPAQERIPLLLNVKRTPV